MTTNIWFQTYFDDIVENELVGIYSNNDDTLDDLIDQSKEVARRLMKHDKLAWNLMLISALWARDRMVDPDEKDDIEGYVRYIISTWGESTMR